MSILFSPLTIRQRTFRNRIVVSPMCQYSAHEGFATDWHLVHLGSRATGGAGLVIQEATAVSPEGRISPGDLGLWRDEHIARLSQIVDFLHSQGALAAIQLAHAGRKGSSQRPWDGGAQIPPTAPEGWQTVAPSPIPFRDGTSAPHALDVTEIERVKADFVAATLRAKKAGYDVVEIHAAHGYLLQEFCSPLTNQRTDQYGGSFENRTRLLLELTTQVKAAWGNDLPLFVRISASDWTDGGWTLEESVRLAGLLKNLGVDLIDTSSGGILPVANIPNTPGYQVDFAAVIKAKAGILTGAVGLITSAKQAESILQAGQADLILLAREMLRNPYFPLQAAKELGVDFPWPRQYTRAK